MVVDAIKLYVTVDGSHVGINRCPANMVWRMMDDVIFAKL